MNEMVRVISELTAGRQPLAGGIVTYIGEPLSFDSIITSEYNIPAALGKDQATTHIHKRASHHYEQQRRCSNPCRRIRKREMLIQ
jgi:hypothetical protein